LTPVLSGEISVKEGAIEQSNFHNYRVLRMKDAPEIQVHLVPAAGDPANGVGSGSAALSSRRCQRYLCRLWQESAPSTISKIAQRQGTAAGSNSHLLDEIQPTITGKGWPFAPVRSGLLYRGGVQ
jgi:hypothetical protein